MQHTTPHSCSSTRSVHTVAVADGKPITADRLREIVRERYKNYDVVANVPTGELFSRENPAKRTLLESRRCNVHRFRMQLLIYMLRRPEARLCSDNLHQVFGPDEGMTPNTLSKAIGCLWRILQPSHKTSSYIIKEPAREKSRRQRACVYTLNTRYKYLVILHEQNISSPNPSQVTAESQLDATIG